MLVLTKEGERLAQQQSDDSNQQRFYAGFVKQQEVAHDAALYVMYQAGAVEVEKRGGTIRRVVLDYELKRRVYAPLAKARGSSPLEYVRRQAEIAAENRFEGPRLCLVVRRRPSDGSRVIAEGDKRPLRKPERDRLSFSSSGPPFPPCSGQALVRGSSGARRHACFLLRLRRPDGS